MQTNAVSKIAVGFLYGMIISCLLIPVVVLTIEELDNSRTSYQAFEVEFTAEYRRARDQGAAWTRNPEEIAIKYVTSDSIDQGLPPDTEHATVRGGEAVVILHDEFLGDDSVAARKYKVELARAGEFWEVEWAGWKHRCLRDGPLSFLKGWHTELCP